MINRKPDPAGISRVPHPSDSPALPVLMIVFFLLGLGALSVHGLTDVGMNGIIVNRVVAGVFFACFLILFATYWVGWLLRGHAKWQDDRDSQSAPRSTDG